MLYELRMYECMPGRLPDVIKNFDTIILKQFEKHGIKQAGFWTTVIGELSQTLYYMLVWEIPRRARTEMERLCCRPGLRGRACKDHGERADHR